MLILCRFLFLPHGILVRSSGASVGSDTSPQFLGWFEDGGFATGYLHLGARPWIAPCPGSPADRLEGTETTDLDVLALLESRDHGFDEAIDELKGFGDNDSIDKEDDESLFLTEAEKAALKKKAEGEAQEKKKE